jgi:hypothetical protein
VSLEELSEAERTVVMKCVRAAAEGPFISEWEFHTLIGLERHQVADVALQWPCLDEAEERVQLAINNSMNTLLLWFGWEEEDPEDADRLLQEWTGASAADIDRIFAKWRAKALQRSPDGSI